MHLPLNIIELGTTGSTNDDAKKLAKDGAAARTVVWAHTQTAGRGRQGNSWVSAPGNLFMSLILRPKAGAADIGQLAFLAAVALANVLETVVPASVKINLKWPNDLLLNHKKAAGILIETEGKMDWVVVGIGVNVTHAPEGAVSLYDLGIRSHDAGRLLELLVQEMLALLQQWEKHGFEDIRQAWLRRAYKLGENITARFPRETLSGVFTGIDPAGALQLLLPDGAVKTMNSGEVFI